MIARRHFIGALGAGAFATQLTSVAQETKQLPRVGFLLQDADLYFDMFRRYMQELGYSDGGNIVFETRNSEGQLDRIPTLVSELVQRKVRVLVTTNNVAIEAARKATTTTPIVMMTSIDPIAAGFVAAFARPGGNVTGIANLQRDLSAKRIEMLREMYPRLSRVAILWDADGPGPKRAFENYEAAAQALKMRVHSLVIRGPNPDFEGTFRAAKTGGAEAMIIVGNPTMNAHRPTILALCLKHRIPSMAENNSYVDAGGLISYGASLSEISQRLAVLVDKILKGAKPAELPVEQPTQFELAINMKTAKALGIKFPSPILLQATKVIE